MFHNYKHDTKDPSNKCSFEIHDLDISIVNGIRRVMLTDISIPGIIGEGDTTIDIIKNDGGLHNEIMSHRIGLIPICLSEDEIDNYIDNSMKIELNVINNNIEMLTVHSGQIKAFIDEKEVPSAKLAKLFPKNMISNSHIVITRLKAGEELHFKASIVKKTARFNSAFCAVSLANFFYIQNTDNITQNMGILDKERVFHMNKFGEATRVQFDIEPINSDISTKYLINKSIEILIGKLNNLSENLTNGSDIVKVSTCVDLKNTFQFVIQDEDDTLGNIIQSSIHNKFIRNNSNSDTRCSYIGYICPHPLKEELVIKITIDDQEDSNKFITFLDQNCKVIIDDLSIVKNTWNKFIDTY